MTAFRRHALTAIALGTVSSAAGAQGAAKKCDVAFGANPNLVGANRALVRALTTTAATRPTHLRSAVAAIEKEEKGGSQLARNWLLGKTLVIWTTVPAGAQGVMTRKAVGFTSNPDASVNVFAAADTALSYVAQNAPQCADSVTWYRRQAWVPVINAANAAANAGKLDSAAVLAQRALLVDPKLPYAYNILGVAAHSRKDEVAAAGYFKQVAATAEGDTAEAVRTMRATALQNTAVLLQNTAETVSEAGKKAELNKEAAGIWKEYLKANPEDANAKAALKRALTGSGDTTAVLAAYSDVLADPSKHSDQQLVEAGVVFVNGGRPADGVKLFEAALAQNPFYRDALLDIAATYRLMGNPEKVGPYARRLVDIDPNNADGWQLLVEGYQAAVAAGKDSKAKKAASDSLVTTMRTVQTLPAKVSVSSFASVGGKRVLSGTVENLAAAPKSYSLKVEFLDKSGSVVATQTADVGPLAPKESKPFTVTAEQGGVVAYRYAPLR
jgi:tetratricopeptide (TPR) repeat protein